MSKMISQIQQSEIQDYHIDRLAKIESRNDKLSSKTYS